MPAVGLASEMRLSWKLFEALLAVLYERGAQRVILTPGGSDHGCDVVVFGWGPQRENLLIQSYDRPSPQQADTPRCTDMRNIGL